MTNPSNIKLSITVSCYNAANTASDETISILNGWINQLISLANILLIKIQFAVSEVANWVDTTIGPDHWLYYSVIHLYNKI